MSCSVYPAKYFISTMLTNRSSLLPRASSASLTLRTSVSPAATESTTPVLSVTCGAPPPRRCAWLAHEVDHDGTHHARRICEKPAAIVGPKIPCTEETQVGLVHKRGGIEQYHVTGLLEARMSKAAQIPVHLRKERALGVSIISDRFVEQLPQIVHARYTLNEPGPERPVSYVAATGLSVGIPNHARHQ